MEPLFVDDRQLITPSVSPESQCVLCLYRRMSQYLNSSIMDIWTDNCHYIERCHSIRAGYSSYTCQATWQVSLYVLFPLISEFPSLQEGCCAQEIAAQSFPLSPHSPLPSLTSFFTRLLSPASESE